MKSSVYKLSQGVFVADFDGRKIMRGSVQDLAAALVQAGITPDELLLGDWREDAELLSPSEQRELCGLMAVGQDVVEQAPGLDLRAAPR
ncbi:hypothetical protein [Acidocella sp.]|uniref:hypothetical protein n=1 Tax=Acidocella sp. TaxID=50710 RepID=UPI003CFC904A